MVKDVFRPLLQRFLSHHTASNGCRSDGQMQLSLYRSLDVTRSVLLSRGSRSAGRGGRALSGSAAGKDGGSSEGEALWRVVLAFLRRRAQQMGKRRVEEQNIRIISGTLGTLFASTGKFFAMAVISSPLVMWISAYMWAYLFRIDICKRKILNSADGALVPTSTGPDSFLSRTGWETEDFNKDRNAQTYAVIGQDEVLERLRHFLCSTPRQVCIIAAPNNSGKTNVIRAALASGMFALQHTFHLCSTFQHTATRILPLQ